MKFNYRAKNREGKVVDGIVDAASEFIARDLLKEKGLEPISIKSQAFSVNNLVAFLNRVKGKDLVVFFRQLSVMVSASIPLIKCLKVLAKQTGNPKLKMIVEEIYQDVDSGSKLSEAMAKHVEVFSNFFVNIIKAGEASGRLAEVLNYVADQQEKDQDLLSKIKGAMIYPVVILIGMGGGGMIMMIKVMPKLMEVFENMGSELPWQTTALMAVSNFLVDYWWIVIAIIVALFLIIRYYGKTKSGKFVLSSIKFRIPVFGKMFKMVNIVRFTRSLHTLMIGGVPLVEAMGIIQEIIDDPIYQEIFKKTQKEVNDGHPMMEELSKHKGFVPDVVYNMIGIGEQSGRLDEMLERVSQFYEKELSNMTSNIMVLMEPLIMIVLGIGVAIMVSAIFVPLYSISGGM
ncbi:MAG TPA: type II secretion system F family protein [bacterium]|nr:type II secretion system F family protein [bacterium]